MNKHDKHSLYVQAFIRAIKARLDDEHDKQLIMRNILYGVKVVNTLPKITSYDEAINNFQLASAIKAVMSLVTPSEFMNIFPIEKDFKGYKYEMKDYFYTIDYINTLDQDESIGEEITRFLWDYTNWEITHFSVAIMGIMSDINHYEGKPSIAEEWADMNGIKTYTKHTDQQGKEFLFDKETGKTIKINKPRPKHLKVVY